MSGLFLDEEVMVMITYILISISNIRCNETEALMNTHVKDLDLLQQVKNKQITFFF